MKSQSFMRGTFKALALILFLALSRSAIAKTKFNVLHNFALDRNGANPVFFTTLTLDKNGNLFGAAQAGGDIKNNYCEGYGCGVIFELSPSDGGRWRERMLYEITDPQSQGEFDSPLALDVQGNLYGCTVPVPGGVSSAFELTPGSRTWTFNPIWPSGCAGPVGLIFDGTGNLYGELGNDFSGDIGELSPGPSGWVYGKLYQFCQKYRCPDGVNPLAPFSWDSKGNLYGTTYDGGDPHCNNCGVAFQMTPNGDGTWTYHVLHRFLNGNDGSNPGTGLTVDAAGNAYGTAVYGGPHGNGDVYKLTPAKSGRWKLNVLYGFPNPSNGWAPVANLVFDKAGNMYGIANGPSGCGYICGVVFRLSPQTNGTWKYSVVHRFTGSDGNFPNGLTMDNKGNLFGTTTAGGKYGYGVVFQITP